MVLLFFYKNFMLVALMILEENILIKFLIIVLINPEKILVGNPIFTPTLRWQPLIYLCYLLLTKSATSEGNENYKILHNRLLSVLFKIFLFWVLYWIELPFISSFRYLVTAITIAFYLAIWTLHQLLWPQSIKSNKLSILWQWTSALPSTFLSSIFPLKFEQFALWITINRNSYTLFLCVVFLNKRQFILITVLR